MTTMASQITSLTVVYSTVYLDADQRKHQSSASLAFVWGIHQDLWIPHTKGQLGGKCFHLMMSSCSICTTMETTHQITEYGKGKSIILGQGKWRIPKMHVLWLNFPVKTKYIPPIKCHLMTNIQSFIFVKHYENAWIQWQQNNLQLENFCKCLSLMVKKGIYIQYLGAGIQQKITDFPLGKHTSSHQKWVSGWLL